MELHGKKLIQAHRGASAYAPENTLEAFALAIEMKADGIELDVHRTKDGHLVVTHDGEISRVSNGSGKIAEMTLAELRQYSFAAGFADKYGHVNIPTLEEVYNLMKPSGLVVNVELKASGTDFVHEVHDCAIACGMKDQVIYSSFNHFNLTDMLDYDADAFVAPLYGADIVKPADYAKLFGAKAIHPHYSQILKYPDIVKRAGELGVRVHPWTVDNEDHLARLFELDIDSIITNKPDVALRIRDGR